MDSIYTDGTYLRNNPAWHAADPAWKSAHVAATLPSTTRFRGYEISPDAYRLCAARWLGGYSLLVLAE